MVRPNTVIVLSVAGSILAGCATRPSPDVEDLPPPAAGEATEHVIDNGDPAFYTTGNWATSTASSGYQGSDYSYSPAGDGSSEAIWNLDIIRTFDIYAKWTSHPNRGSNVKYVIHHLDAGDNLVTETITVDQRSGGGEWVKLGTYRMSVLTGRVVVNNDADGYVIADAILFRELGAPVVSDDSDGDGIPDEWELQYGMDPNDPSDAQLDDDGDGLSNLDEFLLLTDPVLPDTDGDGIPDGFEAQVGLDPTLDDANADPDGDGMSNLEEYQAGTDPNDGDSYVRGNSVLLTWEAPEFRTDGSKIGPDEIDQYEIYFQKVVSSDEVVVDNESDAFVAYGNGGFDSSSTKGAIGSYYFTMPAGTGEVSAEWSVQGLTPGRDYELHANWTSHPNRASNAQYQYTYIDENGSQAIESVAVDQTENGGTWQSLATFTAADSVVTIRINNDANGYVVADAVKVNEAPTTEEIVAIDNDGQNRYVIDDLPEGEWQFKIRAIDSNGLQSDFSNVEVQSIE